MLLRHQSSPILKWMSHCNHIHVLSSLREIQLRWFFSWSFDSKWVHTSNCYLIPCSGQHESDSENIFNSVQSYQISQQQYSYQELEPL